MSIKLSRRKLFVAASGALGGTALVFEAPGADAAVSDASNNEVVVRAWYKLWSERKDWAPYDAILSDDFTFTSPNHDDHISKAAFKARCWDTQIGHTKGFDLQLVMSQSDAVFVKYLGHTVAGNAFGNVELHRLRDGQIISTDCYFGGQSTFPSAVDSKKS